MEIQLTFQQITDQRPMALGRRPDPHGRRDRRVRRRRRHHRRRQHRHHRRTWVSSSPSIV